MRLFAAAFVVAFVAIASQASASAVVAGGFVVAGPVLAGDEVVWADRTSQLAGTVTVRRLSPDGTAVVELTRNGCGASLDLSASELYAALTGCNGEVAIAGLDVPDPTSPLCSGPADFLDTRLVAAGCSGDAALTLIDVQTGSRATLAPRFETGRTALEVRAAGQYIAVLSRRPSSSIFEPTPTPTPTVTPTATATVTHTPTPTPTATPTATTPRFLSVYQLNESNPRFDLSIDTLVGSDAFGDPTLHLALQSDGTALVGASTSQTDDMRFAWANPLSPFLMNVPGTFARTSGRTTLASGVFATTTMPEDTLGTAPHKITILALDGDEIATFDAAKSPDFVERGVVFNGNRISWSTGFVVVHNDALADLEPAAARPRVRITGPRGSRRSRSVGFIVGTASDRDGRVREVRVGLARIRGCRLLDREGRLGAGSVVTRCRPAARYVAQGSEAWAFPLKHRLPPGRYIVKAIARDNSGATGAKKRRFTIRR